VIKLTRLGSVEGYHIDSAGKIGEKASIDSVGKIRVYANRHKSLPKVITSNQ